MIFMNADNRLGFVGIVVENRAEITEVNRILSLYGEIIRGRIGVPNREDSTAVIGLIVEGTNDQVGAMTGKLGNVPGITVKSAMTRKGGGLPSVKKNAANEKNDPS